MSITDEMLELVRQAINAQYRNALPSGWEITRVCEYDPKVHTAPNLHFEKRDYPEAKYLVNLTGPTSSTPALGETVNDAVKRAIAKADEHGLFVRNAH